MEIFILETQQVMSLWDFRRYIMEKATEKGEECNLPDPLPPDLITSLGGSPVMEGAQPTAGRHQSVFRDGVEINEFGVFTKYSLRDWTEEEIAEYDAREAATKREQAKQARQQVVDSITVEVGGKVFDGDEKSQERMARAIKISEITGITETKWTLANNDEAIVTLDELTTALVLAAQKQSQLWSLKEIVAEEPTEEDTAIEPVTEEPVTENATGSTESSA